MSAMLIGREREAEVLAGLLACAREGHSAVVVLRGEPGIGKTSLLDLAVELAEGFRVLRARGVEAESEIAFAGLLELVSPVIDLLARLPERQRAVLEGALALGPPVAGDPLAVRAATLSLLAVAAEDAPLLMLVDDAHWLDAGSAEALVFAGRRLDAERIALVFAVREGDPAEFHALGFDELRVRGLDREAAGRLLELSAAGPVAAQVVKRLLDETARNPLALIELGELLTPGELEGEQPLREPLVAGDAARRAFLRRAQALSAPARDALLVAAAAGDGELAPVLGALEGLGVGIEPLGEVEAGGLIQVGDDRLAFQHPLVRSAVYAAAKPAERRAAHRALAAVLGERAPDRCAWHLSAAALGADEEAAAALEQSAETARRRSGYAAAAWALQRAAQLTPAGRRRVERLVAGAETARQAGRPEQAVRLLQQATEEASESRIRAQIHFKRGRLEWFCGRARQAERRYLDAARLLEPTDPACAALVLVEASLAAQDAGNAAAALATARRAHAAAGQHRDVASDGATEATLGWALYWTGESAEAHGLLSHALSILEDQHLAELGSEEILITADWRAWTGVEVEHGRLLVERVLDEARAAGALGLLPYALHVAFHVLVRDGQWGRAYAAADEGARIAAEVGNMIQHQQLLSYLALIEAAQGRERECREHVARALAPIEGGELTRAPALDDALGLLELGVGDPHEAVRHLDAATAARGDAGRGRRLARPSLGDLVEAHIRSAGAAPPELIAAVARAGEGDFDGSTAVAARCCALVASEDEFDARFVRALELHGSAWPVARARTELCYGERLRRAGRRVEARVQLQAARETFDRLGARPWADRAASELRATGQRVARRDPTAAERLTPQELRVALIIADGATVREAATQLFLSPKTIEAHLGRAYRKLGVRNRAQLATTLAREEPILA